MPAPPETTPNPASVFPPAMSPAVYLPSDDTSSSQHDSDDKQDSSPASKGHFHLPKLRLEIRDLTHKGSNIFLSAVNPATLLPDAVTNVLHQLYQVPNSTSSSASSTTHMPPPPTRSVTLILRSMPGVAYTTGTDLDPDHKEIHFSLNYISSISPSARHTAEITGVITHELVHCYQFNGHGTCPGGLIEGIADWVRLHCDLSPPHWKREAKGDWDGGYQHTAYFLEYLEGRFGCGSVRRVNEKLRRERYREKDFWTELFGRPVEQLWEDYKKYLAEDEKKTAPSKGESTGMATRTKPKEETVSTSKR